MQWNTLCLSCRTVGIPQSQERRLHQLAKEHIFANQNELCMLLSIIVFEGGVQLLHHTKDRNHQT